MLKTAYTRLAKSVITLLAILIGFTASAQKQDALDSTIYYLNQLSGVKANDSLVIDKMFTGIASLKPSVLKDKRFEQSMLKLKKTLPSDQYYSIAYYFLFTSNYKSEAGEYDYPIDYGLTFIEDLKASNHLIKDLFS